RFPKAEAKIAHLAQQIADGLDHAAEEFPSPTVPPAVLRAQLEDYREKSAALARSRAEAKIRRVDKNNALKTLKDSMRADLRYAEVTARRHPERLTQLGWGPRRPRTPLEPPGEVRNMKIRDEGDTWVFLAWDAPDEGGEVAVYQIQRKQPRGKWGDVATSIDRVELLHDQPRGVELEFRVLAMNRAGTGGPSATVKAVL
ncbi:MAG: fibronectin type III domain-containing protein, partial [bacterium]|nr:fibronectin type III domain-containing protein [bacterium]